MSIVELATWKSYSKVPTQDAAGEAAYQICVDSAEYLVKERLGYDPASQAYTAQILRGTGRADIQLKAKPISLLSSVTVDGEARTIADFLVDGERIEDKNGKLFPDDALVVVTYTAGYAAAAMPAIIKLTIMDIASLLAMNRGENIGVSSFVGDGGMSRTFINYNNFDKQISRLEDLRLVRLDP
jgi:hypothetical protein